MFKLRPYQTEAVQATLRHFRQSRAPAVVVLPTGAGKSLVIAELARVARGRVLVLAHVRELVEQNHAKYISLGLPAGIYSAGLGRKDASEKTIFASIQSIARAPNEMFQDFSLLVIDECHRVSNEGETQYVQVISKLIHQNPKLCVLGLTATPYRLGSGWIYEINTHRKMRASRENNRFFKSCIFELSTRYMIDNEYLTPPIQIDSPVACYDFSSLKLRGTRFITEQIESLLRDQKRITPVIIQNIVEMAKNRHGVMIFTSSVRHASEIMASLPPQDSALVVGETESEQRAIIIQNFKLRKIKYLVNVSVLTTGFDAPHVDVIAILRPTESVSLFQQIIGRGLRLSPGKSDCLVLDYTGQGHDLFTPEIEDRKPQTDSVRVDVLCPACGFNNHFWGTIDPDGEVIEHFGRRCQGLLTNDVTLTSKDCGFLFRFKRCDQCNAENDIAARECAACSHLLIDADKKLKEAMALKDAHVMRVDSMTFRKSLDKKGNERLEVQYFDFDANQLREYFYFDSHSRQRAFHFNFARMHDRMPGRMLQFRSAEDVLNQQEKFSPPMFVIARKEKNYWTIREKIFE